MIVMMISAFLILFILQDELYHTTHISINTPTHIIVRKHDTFMCFPYVPIFDYRNWKKGAHSGAHKQFSIPHGATRQGGEMEFFFMVPPLHPGTYLRTCVNEYR